MSHRIVPVEPTEEMLRAAGIRMPPLTEGDEVDKRRFLAQWKAVLAALAAPLHVVTDADVERALRVFQESYVGMGDDIGSVAMRAALEAFLAPFNGK